MATKIPSLVMTGVQEMTLRSEQAIPLPDSDHVRIQVHSCGICGSDMHAYHGHDERRQPPLVLGHEAVGWLEENGTKTRVAINPLMTCGDCPACLSHRDHLCHVREMIGMRLPGSFASEVVIRRDNLWPLPPELGFDLAVLAEPLACSVHAVRLAVKHSDTPLTESTVTILGGGAIGLLIAQVLVVKLSVECLRITGNELDSKTQVRFRDHQIIIELKVDISLLVSRTIERSGG